MLNKQQTANEPIPLATAESLDLSFVIPAMNEEATIRTLRNLLHEAVTRLGQTYEIIFIDDGSTDQTLTEMEQLRKEYPQIRVIAFRRNFGKAAALDAGFRRARGKVIFTMDADLQDDPKEISRFLQKLETGYDVVSGWKQKRHDPLGKTLPSKLFNYVVRKFTHIELNDFNCGFKAYRREATENLTLYGDLHRFVPVLVHGNGFRVGEISVEHHARQHGESKYGWERFTRGFFDLLTVIVATRFSTRPLHFFGTVGLGLGAVGFSLLLYLSALWLMGEGIGQRPLLLLGILLLIFGVQLVSTGLVGELVIRGHRETKPNYVIRSDHSS